MSRLKRFDEFINESTPNQKDTILTKFKAEIEKASHDKHDIVSAYEEIMDEYKDKYPQFSKDFDAAFEWMDKDLPKIEPGYDAD